MSKRAVRVVVVVLAGVTLSGCASILEAIKEPAHLVIDKLPAWAGGPPEGLPPRPSAPDYAAYVAKVEGRAAVTPAADHLPPLH
jgi:hypothetical protein